jgi:hypothetical protein
MLKGIWLLVFLGPGGALDYLLFLSRAAMNLARPIKHRRIDAPPYSSGSYTTVPV